MEGIKIRCQCAFSFYVVFGEGCHLVRCPKCQEYVDKDGSSAGQFPDALSTQLRDPQEDDDTDETFVMDPTARARHEEEAKDERYAQECERKSEIERQKLMKQGYL